MKKKAIIHYLLFCATLLLYGCSVTSYSSLSLKNKAGIEPKIKLNANLSIADQLSRRNTIYELSHNFDLKGQTVTIPDGCTLIFNGGAISNGILVGSNTAVVLRKDSPIFNEVKLNGSYKAEGFPINAYQSNKLDYFYSFLQAFSGTNLYLNDDYNVEEYLGELDGSTPTELTIDGRGHKLKLFSFGAYNIKQCILKNIQIECINNITPQNGWKNDKFNFGIVGDYKTAVLELHNVTFTRECEFAYIRGFNKINVSNCKEEGSYFFIYDCDNVLFEHNCIVEAGNGYYSIGKQSETGQIIIRDNYFRDIEGCGILLSSGEKYNVNITDNYLENIAAGGIILDGGLKHNVNIKNNVLNKAGCGGATRACINIHPQGIVVVSGNKIVANKGASSLDIDAAREEYYSENNIVTVTGNVIKNIQGDTEIHDLALVGLAKLYFENNTITNQCFLFWDTPFMVFAKNKVSFTQLSDGEMNKIGLMKTHPITEKYNYWHYYNNNTFDMPSDNKSYVIDYQSKTKIHLDGKGNKHSHSIGIFDRYNMIETSGDIKLYR